MMQTALNMLANCNQNFASGPQREVMQEVALVRITLAHRWHQGQPVTQFQSSAPKTTRCARIELTHVRTQLTESKTTLVNKIATPRPMAPTITIPRSLNAWPASQRSRRQLYMLHLEINCLHIY